MHLNKMKKILSSEQPFAKHIPISHLVSPSCFETKQFSCGMILRVKGVAFQTKTVDELEAALQVWHQSVLNMGDALSLMISIHRHRVNDLPIGVMPPGFLSELNAAYTAQFTACYHNDIYLTVLHKGGRWLDSPWLNQVSRRRESRSFELARQSYRAEQIETLTHAVTFMKQQLKSYDLHLLGETDGPGDVSELLNVLALLTNGSNAIDYRLPSALPTMVSDQSLIDKGKQVIPMGDLGSYLSQTRIFFGQAIQLQSSDLTQNQFAAMISIKSFPQESNGLAYQSLLQLDGELIATHHFMPIEKQIAIKSIEKQRIKLANANDPALTELSQLTMAKDLIASSDLSMGYYHHSVMLMADSLSELDVLVTACHQSYAKAGAVAIRETIGQETAFWSKIPGNAQYIARASLIHSRHFVDFCPLHHYPEGEVLSTHLKSAVCMMVTPARTPFYFHFHLPQMGTQPSLGHTLVFGASGSGKTATLSFLDAQLKRFDGRTIIFDRDQSMKLYVEACKGQYYLLHPNQMCFQFNPFSCEPTDENKQFCLDFLAELVKKPNESTLPADILHALKHCVSYAFEKLSGPDRRLCYLVTCLPVDFPRYAELMRWVSTEEETGQYAYLFDNASDTLQFEKLTAFDISYFLDHESPAVLSPLLMLLFHRIESCLDGRLTTIILDEGWQCLNHPYWQAKLSVWLSTFRKKNCHLVIATQSVSTVANSKIADILLDNAATQLFFANPVAQPGVYQEQLHLTDKEYDFIKHSPPQERYILIKQSGVSHVARFDFSTMMRYLPVLSADQSTLLRYQSFAAPVKSDVRLWLPLIVDKME